MIKWFAYIVLLLIMAPGLSSANANPVLNHGVVFSAPLPVLKDTTTTKNVKHTDADDKKKIKEIARARRQPKPEKLTPADGTTPKPKPKHQRRPEGLEQPPEIPRRNDN